MSRVEQIEPKSAAKAESAAAEPTIDQVRELLFGQSQRANEARAQEINQTIEALRRDLLDRFAVMDQRIEELAQATTSRHVATVEAIGSAISDLGAQIRKLVEPPARK